MTDLILTLVVGLGGLAIIVGTAAYLIVMFDEVQEHSRKGALMTIPFVLLFAYAIGQLILHGRS